MIGRLGNRCLMWQAMACESIPSCLYSSRTAATDDSSNIFYCGMSARRDLDAVTMRFQSLFAKLQDLGKIDAQQTERVHRQIFFWIVTVGKLQES